MHQNSPFWEPKATKFSRQGHIPSSDTSLTGEGTPPPTPQPLRRLGPRAQGTRPRRLVHTACNEYPPLFLPILVTDAFFFCGENSWFSVLLMYVWTLHQLFALNDEHQGMSFADGLSVLKACTGAEQFVEDRMKRFPCTQCNCSFSMRTNLRRHVKKTHCQPLWRPIPPVKGSLFCVIDWARFNVPPNTL